MAEHQQIVTTTTETTHETHETHEGHKSSLLTDILTIIGFAILFIIIIWGLVHLVELIANSYSPATKPAATIEVSAPAQATSGQPVTISWHYQPSTTGSYAFLYQCQNGLTFQTSSSKDSGIPCGVAYTLGNASSSISLVPVLTSASSTGETVTIVSIPSKGGTQVHGDATMVINPAQKAVAQTSTTKTSSAGTKTASISSYAGPADLSVRIISAYVDQGGTGIVTFDIANIGGSTSGSYTFSAQLPTAQPYPYVSPVQSSLAPGSHITNTLRFTDVASGGGLFSVTVSANDSNTANNYASTQVTAPYTNYNGYNQQPYLQYPSYTY